MNSIPIIGPIIVMKVKNMRRTPINSNKHEPGPLARLRFVREDRTPPHLGQCKSPVLGGGCGEGFCIEGQVSDTDSPCLGGGATTGALSLVILPTTIDFWQWGHLAWLPFLQISASMLPAHDGQLNLNFGSASYTAIKIFPHPQHFIERFL
jgi:hypothetical protein